MSKTIHLLDKRLILRQPEDGFQTSIDAVFVAASCPAEAGQSVLDMGCGVGAAGLCVMRRVSGVHLTGVELLRHEADLAAENAALNDFAAAEIICADVRDYTAAARVDHVICNPPYLEAGAHLRSPSAAKAAAMGHSETSLQDWITCAHRNLKSKGSFAMIHRADALDEIIRLLGKRFGAIEIFPLWPKEGRAAKRVIVRCRKDRHNPMTLHAGIILHTETGDYTDAAERILRGGEKI